MGILIGPAITFFALVAIWKNETRFDFYKAALKLPVAATLADAVDGEDFAFTGKMDTSLSQKGEYVESFHGYLKVWREAEIYCWDRDEDSDNHVTWKKRWMNSVQSNSRNSGVRQTYSSSQFMPQQFQVDDLKVETELIEFVDSSETISPGKLQLTPSMSSLRPEGDSFYLRKGRSDGIGDERVTYSGIPVPSTATYFGKYSNGRAVADTSQQRTGWVNQLIMDRGILHHLVAGEREIALATMKAYIGWLKWLVRGIGTAASVLGVYILVATVFGFLFHVPFLGRLAQTGSFLVALVIGLPLAGLTMVTAYFFAHPLILIVILVFIVGVFWLMRGRARQSQAAIQHDLQQRYGHQVEVDELKELEFIELAQLALSDANYGTDEEKFLKQWANKHGWDDVKFESMMARARTEATAAGTVGNDQHLMNVIRLALADGTLSAYELSAIRNTAMRVGYDGTTINELIEQVQQQAMSSYSQVS